MKKKRKKNQRIRVIGKTQPRIRQIGKTQPKISQKEFAKALGAEPVTDPKEIAKLRRKYPRLP